MLTGLGRRLNDGPIWGLTKRPFSALVGLSNQLNHGPSFVSCRPRRVCGTSCSRGRPRLDTAFGLCRGRQNRRQATGPGAGQGHPESRRIRRGPARTCRAGGQSRCVWLGRRVVGLLWRDDLDTAFRHLDLYDRFGCPSAHIQSSFRCIILHGNGIDPKVADSLNGRVQACWVNPTNPAPPPAAATPPATASNPAGSH